MHSTLQHLNNLKVFAAFTGYYLAERCLRYVVSRWIHHPEFSHKLRTSRKDSVYFGILLGAFISLFSFPFCASALWRYMVIPHFSTSKDVGPRSSLVAEICITSRGVLWVSELNRLDMYPSYMYHHLGSIAMLLVTFHLDVLEILFLPFTTLVSEIPGDFVWILSTHQEMDSRFSGSARWKKRRELLQRVNLWVYGLMRVPSIPIIAYTAIALTRQEPEGWGHSRTSLLYVALGSFSPVYFGWIVVYLRKHRKGGANNDGDMMVQKRKYS